MHAMPAERPTSPPSMLIGLLWISPLVLLCALYPSLIFLRVFVYGGSVGLRAVGEVIGYLFVSGVQLAPLVWRYSRPLAMFTVIAIAAFAQWVVDFPVVPANLAVLVALFSVARLRPLSWSIPAVVVVEVGVVLAANRARSSWLLDAMGLTQLMSFIIPTVLAVMIGVGAIWLAGVYAGTRRRLMESLRDRARRAELERDQHAALAAAAERGRIARELHDVVAHNVGVMVVHADGGRLAMDAGRSQQARQALDTIWTTGRQALAELRRLVGVLRADADPAQQYAPQPGIDQIDDLIEQVRDSGLPVEYRVEGTVPALPPGLQLTIYRVIQESLTNVLKHAGLGTPCTVHVVWRPERATVEVVDSGGDNGDGGDGGDGGHGLVGMRERVAMFGGALSAGPRTGGGFAVRAELPIGQAADARDSR